MHHMVFVHSKMHSAMQSKLLLQSRVHVELYSSGTCTVKLATQAVQG